MGEVIAFRLEREEIVGNAMMLFLFLLHLLT